MVAFGCPERSHRGLVQRFAKPPCGVTCIEGSNPSLSATASHDLTASGRVVVCAPRSRTLGCARSGARLRLATCCHLAGRLAGIRHPEGTLRPLNFNPSTRARGPPSPSPRSHGPGGGLRHGRGTLRRVRALPCRTACARSSVDRASRLRTEGREIESRRARHLPAVLAATADVGARRAARGSPRPTRQAIAHRVSRRR